MDMQQGGTCRSACPGDANDNKFRALVESCWGIFSKQRGDLGYHGIFGVIPSLEAAEICGGSGSGADGYGVA